MNSAVFQITPVKSSVANAAHPSSLRSSPADFDRIARMYRWSEYLTFGPMLSRCRLHFLPQLGTAKRVLVLGDGDGRFLQRFLRINPHAKVDVVDSSARMLKLLLGRVSSVAGAEERVMLMNCDARNIFGEQPSATEGAVSGGAIRSLGTAYDLVVSHFFLDCFTTEEVEELVCRIAPHLAPNARWLVSEFGIPAGVRGNQRLVRIGARVLISGLYFAFGVLTGMRVRTLPEYAAAFEKSGLALSARHPHVWGLLTSELWCPKNSPGTQPKGGCVANLD